MNERGSNKYGYEKKQVSDTNLYLFSITTANSSMRKLWHEDDVVSIVLELNELKKENKKLKERINELDEECAKLCNFNLHNILDKKNKEIKELNSELNKYYKKFNCHQCHYHNYDGLGIDFEYEVCDKGNDEALMYNHSCNEWEEL